MPIFRADPCGIICLGITYSSIFYSDYVIIRWIILTSFYDSLWGSFHIIVFNLIIAFLTTSHLRAVFSDPGLVPIPSTRLDFSDFHSKNKEEGEESSWTVCTRCETYRPPRAHHCRICQRCIIKMDHHYLVSKRKKVRYAWLGPWINNCVGEKNQKYFIQFLLYVGVLALYSAGLVVYGWLSDCPYCPKDLLTKQSRILHSVVMMLISLLFGMFVLAILIDQLGAIFSDETAVEQVKKLGRYRPKKPKMTLLGEVCGRGSVFSWLVPCSQSQPGQYHTESVNYDV